jgi:LppP/LprE lipoprotein
VGDDPRWMEATARRVRAERNRRRLPPRGALARWTRRIMGLLATAAFLGVGVASYKMIAPDHKTPAAAALEPAPTAAPAKHHHKRHKRKHHGLSKAQKAARTAAVAEVRRLGYLAVKPSDYDPKATFRVLIGRPVGDPSGGSYAFFFNGGSYIGRDSLSPSASLKVAKQTKTSVTLNYGTCCPAKRVPVRFKLQAGRIQPLQVIPASYLRAVRR